jgi:hypothetical protein
MRARLDMEIKEDREKVKEVITAVTEGFDAVRKSKKSKKYSFEKLVGDSKKKSVIGTDEGEVGDDEFDEEEMLQKGLKSMLERNVQNGKKRKTTYNSDDSSEFESGSEEEDNMLPIGMIFIMLLFS